MPDEVKNEVFSHFLKLKNHMKNETNSKIQCLRSNGGQEYLSTKFVNQGNSLQSCSSLITVNIFACSSLAQYHVNVCAYIMMMYSRSHKINPINNKSIDG